MRQIKKLSLNKETIKSLEDGKLRSIQGGAFSSGPSLLSGSLFGSETSSSGNNTCHTRGTDGLCNTLRCPITATLGGCRP